VIRASLYGVEDTTTFAAAVILYLKTGHSHRFLSPLVTEIGERILTTIKPGEVRDLACKLYPHGAPSTRNRQAISPFLAVLNFACDRGKARPIKIKRFNETKVNRIAVDRRWIDMFRSGDETSPYLAAMALMMFATGARLGDAISLVPSDIDFKTMTARCRRTKSGEPHDFLLTKELSEELLRLRHHGCTRKLEKQEAPVG
jgi:integrase